MLLGAVVAALIVAVIATIAAIRAGNRARRAAALVSQLLEPVEVTEMVFPDDARGDAAAAGDRRTEARTTDRFNATRIPVLDLDRRTSWWDDLPGLRAALMSPRQIRAMEHAGMEFGSHSLSHRSLPQLTDSELAEELTRSREVLGSIVERPLAVLAYPYGDANERVKRAVQRAGYSAALAVNSGPLAIETDRYEIRRVRVTNRASEAYMKFKLSGAEQRYRWLKWKVRQALRFSGLPGKSHGT